MITSNTNWEQRSARMADSGLDSTLHRNLVGLEKEGLRVSSEGTVAATPHPAAFGSALTHPYVTTDFSEALLELITPALADQREALDFLQDLHVYAYRHLDDELLWATSMPCVLGGARDIPLAYYGTSNAALMKTTYRRGLGNRYGRVMQVIAGVHYNFSFAEEFFLGYQEIAGDSGAAVEFRSKAYMALIRNLQRYGWLISFLFGASPAVCKSFVQGRRTDLVELDPNTLHYPFATSLRMGDIGYQNRQTQGTGMKASYNNLDSYIRSLTWAIETPCPNYEDIGVKVGDRYEQLNANVLQIENEYYSTVRPKQLLEWLEKPTVALRRRGVRYVEVRSLDANAFHPLGVSEEQLSFMDSFMLFCLLSDSPRIDARERRAIDNNQVLAAHQGRDPNLRLERSGRAISLRAWAKELLSGMATAADLLDGGSDGPCAKSLGYQQDKVRNPELTPSARMLAEMRINREGFFEYARRISEQHRNHFRALTLSPEREELFRRLCTGSLEKQRAIEEADELSFDEFLDRYFAQSD